MMATARTILLLTLAFLLTIGCRKNRDKPEVEKLPPATQTGANTFGCLVNGKAFKPKGPSLSPILFCYYQYIVDNSSNGYYLGLAASDKSNPEDVMSVGIYTDSVAISEGVHPLTTNQRGAYFGKYVRVNNQGTEILRTTHDAKGELTITRHDPTKSILSGTFWFDVVDANGKKIEIREGRFDVRYSR